MSVKTIYKCDRCGHEYQEIDLYQGEGSESTITVEITLGSVSTFNKTYTPLMNGEKINLCNNCTKGLRKFLREFGFKNLYCGCISEQKM